MGTDISHVCEVEEDFKEQTGIELSSVTEVYYTLTCIQSDPQDKGEALASYPFFPERQPRGNIDAT
jgi:hypothetical protein